MSDTLIDDTVVNQARTEYASQGVLSVDTYMALSNAGYTPESLIEEFEEEHCG